MKRKEIEKAIDRHIRITDMDLLKQIDEIMEHSKYKSFSKALYVKLVIVELRICLTQIIELAIIGLQIYDIRHTL